MNCLEVMPALLYNSCYERGVCDIRASVPAVTTAGHMTKQCRYSLTFSSFNFRSKVCHSFQFNSVNFGRSKSSLFLGGTHKSVILSTFTKKVKLKQQTLCRRRRPVTVKYP